MAEQEPQVTDARSGHRAEPSSRSTLPVALRISSLSDVVALAGLLGSCLYFYSRAYNAVFLSSFGLGVGVIPMSVQDAMVDGLEGVTLNILYLWVPMATAFLLYFLWSAGSRFFEPEQQTPPPSVELLPQTWWARRRAKVQADIGLSRLLTLLLSIMAAPAVLVLAVVIIAIPAELSARKDVAALRVVAAGSCATCSAYEYGGRTIVGRPVASTADRLFVLSHEGPVVPIRLDDLRSVALPSNR